MNDNIVVYTKCPHCHKGWYGKPIGGRLYYIEGLNPTDLTKKVTCLNCHHDYVPADYAVVMDKFVAERLTTCKGH